MSQADPTRRALMLAGLALPLAAVASRRPKNTAVPTASALPEETSMSSTTVTIELKPKLRARTLEVLSKALPVTRQYAGCQYCNTYLDHDADTIVLIQGWDSREHQQRYIAWRESTGDLQQLVDTLTSPPQVRFWSLTDV